MVEVNDDSITIKRCYSSNCQVCGRQHEDIEIIYFVPLDNNLVCFKCAKESGLEFDPRIYLKE